MCAHSTRGRDRASTGAGSPHGDILLRAFALSGPENSGACKYRDDAQGMAAELGFELEEGMAGGGSDGNNCSQFTVTLDGLGAVGDGAHAHHEFIFVDQLFDRTALLALLIMAPGIHYLKEDLSCKVSCALL